MLFRSNIELMVTSLVILVVHQDGFAAFKRKSQTPVAVDADRPVARKAALEGMPAPPRTVHVFGPCGRVQRRQLPSQARGMSRFNPGTRAGLEEAFNAFVPEASDHASIVACGATRSKLGVS